MTDTNNLITKTIAASVRPLRCTRCGSIDIVTTNTSRVAVCVPCGYVWLRQPHEMQVEVEQK